MRIIQQTLIYKRVSVDKKTALNVGKLLGGIGTAAYCIAGLGLVVCISKDFGSVDVGVILFFGITGFVLRKVSDKLKKEAEDVKRYLAIIVNNHVSQIDAIASATGKSYDVVKKDLIALINKEYLKNAYINESTREIILPSASADTPQHTVNNHNAAAEVPAAKVVSCSCCGANNTIYGDMSECEYCGSPLK